MTKADRSLPKQKEVRIRILAPSGLLGPLEQRQTKLPH